MLVHLCLLMLIFCNFVSKNFVYAYYSIGQYEAYTKNFGIWLLVFVLRTEIYTKSPFFQWE